MTGTSSKNKQIAAILLAAGKGTRMGLKKPKVLQSIANKPLIRHSIDKVQKLGLEKIVVVVGNQKEIVKKAVPKEVEITEQEELLGTGDAVRKALSIIPKKYSTIMVLNGDDSVFYSQKTLQEFIDYHLSQKSKITILTSIQKKAEVSGRVFRDTSDAIVDIKPNAEMNEIELKNNHEVVCGIYIFERNWLETYAPLIKPTSKGEYNITSLIFKALNQGGCLNDMTLANPNEWRSINTPKELMSARRLWRKLH